MIAPPPMPNRPARMPVTRPPATIAKASQASSASGTPVSTSGRNVGRFAARVPYKADRVAQDPDAGARPHGMRRDVTAEGTCARHPLEQTEQMPRDRVQPRAASKLALGVGEEVF